MTCLVVSSPNNGEDGGKIRLSPIAIATSRVCHQSTVLSTFQIDPEQPKQLATRTDTVSETDIPSYLSSTFSSSMALTEPSNPGAWSNTQSLDIAGTNARASTSTPDYASSPPTTATTSTPIISSSSPSTSSMASSITLEWHPSGTVLSSTYQTSSSLQISSAALSPGLSILGNQSAINSSSPISSANDGGVSSGTLAGTAIACLLAGAVTAVFLTWAILAYRRKHRSRLPHAGLHSEAASSSNEEHKYVPLVPVSNGAIAQAVRSEPEAAPTVPPKATAAVVASTIKRKRISVISVNALDKALSALRTQVKTLFEQIEMHVDNFYADRPKDHNVLTQEQQEQIREFDTPFLEDSIAGLLPEAEQSRIYIKHCLTYAIISGIDFSSSETRNHPLLPGDMLSLYRAMSSVASDQQSRQWRSDTMSLLGSDVVGGAVNVSAVAHSFTQAFSLWASVTYSPEARVSHLKEVIREAVELGCDLFGRPGDFGWRWQSDCRPDGKIQARDVTVFPGLSVITATNDLELTPEHSDDHGKGSLEIVAPMVAAL